MKLPKYAYAGIQEAWLIDLQNESVETHNAPSGFAYNEIKTYQRGEEISSATLPEIKFSVDDILG